MVCSESVGTAALSDYVSQQSFIEGLDNKSIVYNDDFVGIASFNIFVGVAVATIFGAAFFFDLFWPERDESKSVKISWKISAVAVCFMAFADAIAMTVIVATRSATITGVDAGEATALLLQREKPPLVYRKNGRCVAATVLLWLGMIATIASTIILFKSYRHNEEFGPKTRTGKRKDAEQAHSKTSTEMATAS